MKKKLLFLHTNKQSFILPFFLIFMASATFEYSVKFACLHVYLFLFAWLSLHFSIFILLFDMSKHCGLGHSDICSRFIKVVKPHEMKHPLSGAHIGSENNPKSKVIHWWRSLMCQSDSLHSIIVSSGTLI